MENNILENKTNNIMEKINNINYLLVHEAFQRDGWTMYHQFMVGNRWVKGKDTITCYYGVYKLNGVRLSNESLIEMLHIDRRAIAVCAAIAPHQVHGAYGRAFLEGVRWADAHPDDKKGGQIVCDIFSKRNP